MNTYKRYRPTPGEETQDIPDEVDVLEGGDVVQGVGGYGLASGSSSASGWRVFSGAGFSYPCTPYIGYYRMNFAPAQGYQMAFPGRCDNARGHRP